MRYRAASPRLEFAVTQTMPTLVADIDNAFPTTTSTRLSAVVRLVACFASVHSVFQLYATDRRNIAAQLALLFIFTVYVGVLYYKVVRDGTSQEPHFIYWIDTLWYLALTAITGGHLSHFSFFLPFPILFFALRRGFTPGITMAIFSAVALLLMSIVSAGLGNQLLSTDNLLPPIALLVLGYLIASWANSNLVLQRRLGALKKINSLFSPRLNIEQVIDKAVKHLATLCPINKYALTIVNAHSPARVFRASLPERMYQVSDIAALEINDVLLTLDASTGPVVFVGKHGVQRATVHRASASGATVSDKQLDNAIAIANRLDCLDFGSIQFNLRDGGIACLFVGSTERCFGPTDLQFFSELAEQLSPRIENVQLLDSLASEVAEHERQKISRDIHDSAIQPYIGLKFALEALARKAAPTDPLAQDIARLVDMAHGEITELRRYVKGLRGQSEPGHATLLPALRRQTARFGDLYGIKVDIETSGELRVGDKLADDAFHMVGEALSNIRRHTTAPVAHINLFCDEQLFRLQIANPCDSGTQTKLFTPRSIAERAYALNGTCRVETSADRDTVVIVEIPFQKT